MSRAEADDLMAAYDLTAQAYRLAVKIGMPADKIDAAFAKWNEAREALIDALCGEAETGRAA